MAELVYSVAEAAEALGISRPAMYNLIVEGGLSVLDDEERLVLDRFYIHRAKGNVGELCERLNVEQATVYRKRDIALRRFTIALYGPLEGL